MPPFLPGQDCPDCYATFYTALLACHRILDAARCLHLVACDPAAPLPTPNLHRAPVRHTEDSAQVCPMHCPACPMQTLSSNASLGILLVVQGGMQVQDIRMLQKYKQLGFSTRHSIKPQCMEHLRQTTARMHTHTARHSLPAGTCPAMFCQNFWMPGTHFTHCMKSMDILYSSRVCPGLLGRQTCN